jgi:hypothetical protein
MLLDWNGREKALIHLIDAVEKKIGINNVEQMDIQNKTYWPVCFIAEQNSDKSWLVYNLRCARDLSTRRMKTQKCR